MNKAYTFFWLSQHILEISWQAEIAENSLMKMISTKELLSDFFRTELLEIRQGYHAIALHFKKPNDQQKVVADISQLIEDLQIDKSPTRKRWLLPVCYSPEIAKDLSQLAYSKGLSVEDLVYEHSKGDYMLFFYGFLPGFMYLGGLTERLYTPRKSFPDPLIQAGSVAIGGKQTGIYPIDSPGGWHVIGKIPFRLFDPTSVQLPPFVPGDIIRFRPISYNEFEVLCQNPELTLEHEVI